MAERLLFVTGKLAAPALRDTLDRTELPFDYEVAVMKITVAALMTTDWIARFLEPPEAVTKIMIPGLCEGETDVLAERFGIPVEKGPADLKRLPSWFGQADARASYGPRDIRVFAEINHVPRLSRDRILELAGYYRDAGADVIDLGLSLGRRWLDEGPAVIAELRERGFVLSIDTMDPEEILMADEAGVDYVLSLNGSNRDLAERLRATPVLIPDTPEDLDSLEATIAHLERLGKPYLVDPIIEPIGTGFAASLGRYLEVRRRHPEAEMFMGIGNLTELTEADSTGVTAMLIGFCQELGIRNVLTTEVIEWAHGAVQEAVLAAQLMHFAQEQGTPPKHVDGRLLTVKDEDLRPYAESELRELHAQVTDPNFRIFADSDWIYVFNAELLRQGHRLQRDLRPARGRRGDARLLSRQGADEGHDRARPGQELPPGVAPRLGLHDLRGAAPQARAADGGGTAREKVVAFAPPKIRPKREECRGRRRRRAAWTSRMARRSVEYSGAEASGRPRRDPTARCAPRSGSRRTSWCTSPGSSSCPMGACSSSSSSTTTRTPTARSCRAMATPSSSGW